MTYSFGNTILDDDYNGFKDSVNTMWSTGSGDAGYGQTAISAVSAGSTISATQWASLLNPITSAASHQGATITSIINPSAGGTISAFTALNSNISAVTGATRHNAVASGSDSSATTTTTSAWTTSATTTKTITFATADQYRYFFNAGGMIRMSWARSGGTTSGCWRRGSSSASASGCSSSSSSSTSSSRSSNSSGDRSSSSTSTSSSSSSNSGAAAVQQHQ